MISVRDRVLQQTVAMFILVLLQAKATLLRGKLWKIRRIRVARNGLLRFISLQVALLTQALYLLPRSLSMSGVPKYSEELDMIRMRCNYVRRAKSFTGCPHTRTFEMNRVAAVACYAVVVKTAVCLKLLTGRITQSLRNTLHASIVKKPLVKISAVCSFVGTYSMKKIPGSFEILSNNQSKSTR